MSAFKISSLKTLSAITPDSGVSLSVIDWVRYSSTVYPVNFSMEGDTNVASPLRFISHTTSDILSVINLYFSSLAFRASSAFLRRVISLITYRMFVGFPFSSRMVSESASKLNVEPSFRFPVYSISPNCSPFRRRWVFSSALWRSSSTKNSNILCPMYSDKSLL